MFWNYCTECFEKYDNIERRNKAATALSKRLSHVLRKKNTLADAQKFLDTVKNTERDAWAAAQEYFSNYPPAKIKTRKIQKSASREGLSPGDRYQLPMTVSKMKRRSNFP